MGKIINFALDHVCFRKKCNSMSTSKSCVYQTWSKRANIEESLNLKLVNIESLI